MLAEKEGFIKKVDDEHAGKGKVTEWATLDVCRTGPFLTRTPNYTDRHPQGCDHGSLHLPGVDR
jgi:hypothetical protein